MNDEEKRAQLRRLIANLTIVSKDFLESDRPNKLEEVALFKRLIKSWRKELWPLEEEHNRLLIAVCFHKHRELWLRAACTPLR